MSAGTCFKGRSSSTLAAYGTNQSITINGPASSLHGDFADKVLAARFDRVPVLISVVIPTLGRASLKGAIESAVKQSVPVSEILVINDSGATLDGFQEPRVRIIDTQGGLGAAGARQIGVAASGGEFVAFLDDDDEWLDGHLEDALNVLTTQTGVAVYAARAEIWIRDADPAGPSRRAELRLDGIRPISPPVVYQGPHSLISFLYGWRAFLGRSRHLPTPTVVARRKSVDSTIMDPHLLAREDIAWLLDLEASGCKISQSKRCGARVFADVGRMQGRITTDIELDWAHRLDSLQRGTGSRYVALVAARRLARSGDPDQLRELARRFKESSPMSPATRLVTLGFTVLAHMVRMAGRDS